MTLNYALLERVRDHIDQHPHSLDMQCWINSAGDSGLEGGTIACLGGWLAIMALGETETRAIDNHPHQNLAETAMRVTGLSTEELTLFSISRWPPFFRHASATTHGPALAASALLNVVIDTQGAVLHSGSQEYYQHYPAALVAAEERQRNE